MSTDLPEGPFVMWEFEGADGQGPVPDVAAYSYIYAGEDHQAVFICSVSTEDMSLEQAQLVGQRIVWALSWTEPEILDGPDGPGLWWWRWTADEDWQIVVSVRERSPGKLEGLLDGAWVAINGGGGGQWTKALPPGPAPASEDGELAKLQAVAATARAVVEWCKGWGYATGNFTELGLKIHSMSEALDALRRASGQQR